MSRRLRLQAGEGPAIVLVAVACAAATVVILAALPSGASGTMLWQRFVEICTSPFVASPARDTYPPRIFPPLGRPHQVARGAVVARQVCQGCHGSERDGYHAAFAPRLDGLSAGYLAKQLEDYAAGRRTWPVMEAVAAALTRDDRAAVASYYESLPIPSHPIPEYPRFGASLARAGDPARFLPACTACHGPQGAGVSHQAPRLAGRPVADIAHALNMFRDGARRNDAARQMRNVAKALTDAEIAALAAYWASVPPPKPAR